MRPIKLMMRAFGPYADTTVIDFEKLGTNGLYLITGDTGAGKTTIFDGITYALFGEASGNNRDSSMMRSKYADSETPTEVELVFVNAGKQYTVKRNPEYERQKTRGIGVTKQTANAELYLQDGKTVTKTRDVDQAIRGILGVTREQFSQIAMIAQGDFLKLLLAETQDRQKIFRSIFRTEYYQKLQDSVKDAARDVNNQYDACKASIRQYLDGTVADEADPLADDLRRAQNGQMPLSEAMQILDAIIRQDEEQIKADEKQREGLDAQLNQVTILLGKVEAYEKTESEHKKTVAELEAKQTAHKAAEEQLKTAKARQPERDALHASITALEMQLPDYDAREERKARLAKTEAAIQAANEKKERTDAKLKTENDQLTVYRAERQSLEHAGENKERLIAQKTEVEKALEELNQLAALLDACEKADRDYRNAQQIYRDTQAAAEQAQTVYETKNHAFLDEQAGVLALTLEEDRPCPVCGSLHHPDPAKLSENAPTKEEVQKAKSAADRKQREASNASETAAALRGQAEEKRTEAERKTRSILGEVETIEIDIILTERRTAQKAQIAELEKAIRQEQENILRRDRLDKDIQSAEASVKASDSTIREAEKELASLRSQREGTEREIIALDQKLAFPDRKAATAERDRFAATCSAIEHAMETAEKAFRETETQKAEIEGRIRSLEVQLQNAERLDRGSLETQRSELSDKRKAMIERAKTVHARVDRNRTALQHIMKQAAEQDSLEQKLKWLRTLSNTVNGTLTGKEKVMLETYVQMTYFDRILARANTRLMVMSGGQYELKRRIEADNKNSKSGLELDVLDHYNGTLRSVKTLSGGESFKASLSLALGLSDEIQSSAGGIHLDTMFVDEGFGSLDEESLQQALKALSALTESNRLVGIISHVSELKTRIDKQIVVKKEKSGGSRVEMIA